MPGVTIVTRRPAELSPPDPNTTPMATSDRGGGRGFPPWQKSGGKPPALPGRRRATTDGGPAPRTKDGCSPCA